MKKLLTILSAVSMLASSSSLVISCGNKDKNIESDKLDLNFLNIKNGLNKIDLNSLNSILQVNEAIVKILNESYENKYNLKLNEDIQLNIFKDDKMSDDILSYDDLIKQNYIYIKFVANTNSDKVINSSQIFEFEIISKESTKTNLKDVNIQEGLNKFNLNNLFDLNDIKENAVATLNAATGDILDLKLKEDVTVLLYLDYDGKIATSEFSDITDKDAIYIQFSAIPYSTKVENKSDIFKFNITKKDATDLEIANEITKVVKKNFSVFEDTDNDSEGVSKQKIIDAIKDHIPDKISINNSDVKKYDKNNVNILFENDQKNYQDTVTSFIEYKNVKSETNLVINISSDKKVINSKKLTNLSTHYIEYVSQNSSADVKKIDNDVWSNLKTIGITSENFSLNSSIVKKIDGTNEGEYQYKVVDSSGNELINFNSTDENNKTTFSLLISTEELKQYKKLSTQLNNFSNNEEPSSSLRYISLFDFFPSKIFGLFNNSSAITDLLKSITLGNFVDWFFEPTGKYAKLMPRSMPKLDENGIMKNENKDFWNYINTIANDFKSQGIDVINELKADFTTKIDGRDASVSINIYNLILNIMPDLIHFHNYIINENVKNENANYLLLFIKYLIDDVKNYDVQTDTEHYLDNFSKINENAPNLKTNFDVLLHNMIEPFTYESNIDSSKSLTSKIPSPIDFRVNLGIAWQKLNWKALAGKEIPSTILFKNVINDIIQNPSGKDINEDVEINLKLTIFTIFSFNKTFNFSLSSLHAKEIKSLIKNELHFGSNFDDSEITTEKGRLFLIGKNNKDEWVEIHSLNDLQDVKDLKFWFKGFRLKITNNNDRAIYLTQEIDNFYLEL